jgi:hypothetical protein
MKKILFIAVGLMSLLGISSCDATSKYLETEEFYPYCFKVKDATTIQILGVDNLNVAELEKTDWEIIAQTEAFLSGSQPLLVTESNCQIYYADKNSERSTLGTNADPLYENEGNTLTVVVRGLTTLYTYLGKEVKLQCISPIVLKTEISVKESYDSPFIQKGTITYSLMAHDTICLAQKDMPYTIGTPEGYLKLNRIPNETDE